MAMRLRGPASAPAGYPLSPGQSESSLGSWEPQDKRSSWISPREEGKPHGSSILNSESADGAGAQRWLVAGKQAKRRKEDRKEKERGAGGGSKATVSMQSPPCESAFRMHTCGQVWACPLWSQVGFS